MNRYHYIDGQGNISDALPLNALEMINLAPTTKVLLEGVNKWICLEEIRQREAMVPPPSPVLSSSAAQSGKTATAKGCFGCMGVIFGSTVLLGIIGGLFGPSNSGENDSQKAKVEPRDSVLAVGLQGWLSLGPWKCVEAVSKNGEGFPGLMKGATFEFAASELRISGGGAEVSRTCRIESVRKSFNADADLFATLHVGEDNESLLQLKPEGGFDFAAMSWMNGAWTLKLARSQR